MLGLRRPVHRRQRLRARATAGSCCCGQAGHSAHLTRHNGLGATKNGSWECASIAEAHPLQLTLDLNGRSFLFCASTAAFHLPAKAEKGAQLRRVTATHCIMVRASDRRGRLLPIETCNSPLGAALGHATLGCPGPSRARSSNGPSGASGSSLAIWAPALGRDRADSHGGRPGWARSSLAAKQRLQQAQRTRHQHELGHSEHLRARGTEMPGRKPQADVRVFRATVAAQRTGGHF